MDNKLMEKKYLLKGLDCANCAAKIENAVKKAVSSIKGVTDVTVDLAGKTVIVTHDENVTADTIRNEIEVQGYDVVV